MDGRTDSGDALDVELLSRVFTAEASSVYPRIENENGGCFPLNPGRSADTIHGAGFTPR